MNLRDWARGIHYFNPLRICTGKSAETISYSPLRCYQREVFYEFHINAKCITLIGNASVKETISNNKRSLLKSRFYYLIIMLSTIRFKKKQLRQRRNWQKF